MQIFNAFLNADNGSLAYIGTVTAKTLPAAIDSVVAYLRQNDIEATVVSKVQAYSKHIKFFAWELNGVFFTGEDVPAQAGYTYFDITVRPAHDMWLPGARQGLQK